MMKLIKKIYEKIRDADLNEAMLFSILFALLIIAMLCFYQVKQEREIRDIKQRIDSCLNSPEVKACEQFNRNIDSLLYKTHGPYCLTCGQKLKYYSEE